MEFFEDGRLELYNLRADIGEKQNVATEEQQVVADLHSRLRAWREEVGAAMPTPNPDPVPAGRKNDAE
jgi:hypothetical protein